MTSIILSPHMPRPFILRSQGIKTCKIFIGWMLLMRSCTVESFHPLTGTEKNSKTFKSETITPECHQKLLSPLFLPRVWIQDLNWRFVFPREVLRDVRLRGTYIVSASSKRKAPPTSLPFPFALGPIWIHWVCWLQKLVRVHTFLLTGRSHQF